MGADGIVLGRGMVFFDRFAEGTLVGEGERYIGNTTAFSIRRDLTEIERLQAANGLLSKRDSLVVREKIDGAFVTDIISVDNAAAWFGSVVDEVGQENDGFITESFVVRRGRFYQLGKSYAPFGVRHVENATFQINGSPLNIAGQIQLDKVEARFEILPEANLIDDGDTISVTFEWRASPLARSWTSSPKSLTGALRFIATNPVGAKKNYFFPSVTITPSGEASLKGDEWQQLAFSFEAKPLSPRHAQMYVIETGLPALTEDEQAIVDLSGVSLDEFPYWDDRLNTILNISIPSRDY